MTKKKDEDIEEVDDLDEDRDNKEDEFEYEDDDEEDEDGDNDDDDDDDDEDECGIETGVGVILLTAAGITYEATEDKLRPIAKFLQEIFEAEGYEREETDRGSIDFLQALLDEIADMEVKDNDALIVGSMQELAERLSTKGLTAIKNAVKTIMKRDGEYSPDEMRFIRQLKEIWQLNLL
ncbi:MAG: hypothetical protein HQM09_05655 [Candidatus Riflebacteria bacterium]|nr:hypothetical protein [Candidatus Riflebacteria bacterium]